MRMEGGTRWVGPMWWRVVAHAHGGLWGGSASVRAAPLCSVVSLCERAANQRHDGLDGALAHTHVDELLCGQAGGARKCMGTGSAWEYVCACLPCPPSPLYTPCLHSSESWCATRRTVKRSHEDPEANSVCRLATAPATSCRRPEGDALSASFVASLRRCFLGNEGAPFLGAAQIGLTVRPPPVR
jgi:hypothetical protein